MSAETKVNNNKNEHYSNHNNKEEDLHTNDNNYHRHSNENMLDSDRIPVKVTGQTNSNNNNTNEHEHLHDRDNHDDLNNHSSQDDPDDPEERAKKIHRNFKKIRPYLFQLITHGIILFISIYAYLDYISSVEIYTKFAQTLKEPLIVDIKAVNEKDPCPKGYQMYGTATIPAPKAGCRCDLGIYQESICKNIEENLNISTSSSFDLAQSYLNYKCNTQDTNINVKITISIAAAAAEEAADAATTVVSPSEFNVKRDLISLEDYQGNIYHYIIRLYT